MKAMRAVRVTRTMIRTMAYEERFYRGLSRPSDLHCFEVKLKETDLFCCASQDVREVIENKVIHYRHQLEEYIRHRPDFLRSLVPIDADPLAPNIAKQMIAASGAVGVGPMACVAGAVADVDADGVDASWGSTRRAVSDGGERAPRGAVLQL